MYIIIYNVLIHCNYNYTRVNYCTTIAFCNSTWVCCVLCIYAAVTCRHSSKFVSSPLPFRLSALFFSEMSWIGQKVKNLTNSEKLRRKKLKE